MLKEDTTTRPTLEQPMQTTTDLPEGKLRTSVNLDGHRLQLRYDAKYGYHITFGLALYARNLKSLELGICIFEALCMVEDKDIAQTIKHVRTEFKRLELARYESSASKQNAIIYNALRRLEGYTVRTHKQVEVWTKTEGHGGQISGDESLSIMAFNASRRVEQERTKAMYDRSISLAR